jgi:hypothetical protein
VKQILTRIPESGPPIGLALLIKGIEAIGVRIGGLSEAHPEIAASKGRTNLE